MKKLHTKIGYLLILTALVFTACGKKGKEDKNPIQKQDTPVDVADSENQVEPIDSKQEAKDKAEQSEDKTNQDEVETQRNHRFTEDDALSILSEQMERNPVTQIQGMSFTCFGQEEMINGENCIIIEAGTNHEENFVKEHSVAVSPQGAIYLYDFFSNEWNSVNVTARLNEGWDEERLFTVLTDPYSDEFMEYYEGIPSNDHILIIAMQDNVNIRVEQIQIDENTGESVVTGVDKEIGPCMRGEIYDLPIVLEETIPTKRIVGECGEKEASWEAIYDGPWEGGIIPVTTYGYVEDENNLAQIRYGNVTLLEERENHNFIWLEIQEQLIITPEDKELIKQYGLSEDLDGYDYEVVPRDEDSRIYIAMKDGSTQYGILDPEYGVMPEDTDWSGFLNQLIDKESLFVTFSTHDSGGVHEDITEIRECYIP